MTAMFQIMNKCSFSYFTGPRGVAAIAVEVVHFGFRSARQQNVHIQIIFWSFVAGPELSQSLVHQHSSLGRDVHVSSWPLRRLDTLRVRGYLGRPKTSTHSLLLVEPSDNWHGFFKRLYERRLFLACVCVCLIQQILAVSGEAVEDMLTMDLTKASNP